MKTTVILFITFLLNYPNISWSGEYFPYGANKTVSPAAKSYLIEDIVDVSANMDAAKVHGILGAVRDGVNMLYASNLAQTGKKEFPVMLDHQGDGPCKSCFSAVLEEPISAKEWSKKGSEYIYKKNGYLLRVKYEAKQGVLTEIEEIKPKTEVKYKKFTSEVLEEFIQYQTRLSEIQSLIAVIARQSIALKPLKLDDNPDGKCQACFINVLGKPLKSNDITKQGDIYRFKTPIISGFSGGLSEYIFKYDGKIGAFEIVR